MERIAYRGWPNCYRLANGKIELVVTSDVGPRIIHCAAAGGENLFKVWDDTAGKTGGDAWHIYGGHRLWHAPEVSPRTYAPDNAPVKVKETKRGLRVMQPVESTTDIEKQMDIALVEGRAEAVVTHKLSNRGPWPVEIAPWGVSAMDAGGRVIVPMPPRGTHPECLLPANTLTLWPYTDMRDPRWTWGFKYVMLQQDVKARLPQKAGFMTPDGWCACAVKGCLFVKSFDYVAGAKYPDFGASIETFTNEEMIELETVAPLVTLAPGESAEHVERWSVFPDVPAPKTDEDVERDVLPKVREARP
jgi:hypothetical protein